MVGRLICMSDYAGMYEGQLRAKNTAKAALLCVNGTFACMYIYIYVFFTIHIYIYVCMYVCK